MLVSSSGHLISIFFKRYGQIRALNKAIRIYINRSEAIPQTNHDHES